MVISSGDADCRYLAAPGTKTSSTSHFGSLLKKLQINLPKGIELEQMVAHGWVRPVLRVILPKEAFEAWANYATVSPMDADACPPEHIWALELYAKAVTGPMPFTAGKWWIHMLDDGADPLAAAAKAHTADSSDSASLPPSFRHSYGNQEIWPWLDYFAYWQAFQIADYQRLMTVEYVLPSDPPRDAEKEVQRRRNRMESIHVRLSAKWQKRYAVFDWLSRMRTVLGAGVEFRKTFEEQTTKLREVAETLSLTVDQMRNDVRATLLEMWTECKEDRRFTGEWQRPLVHLLRQEIQYAVYFIEQISDEPVDALDNFWSPKQPVDDAAPLIAALPREEDLTRRDFPQHARFYFDVSRKAIPLLLFLDENAMPQFLAKHWDRSRALRRFVLAFYRLHDELHGEQLTGQENVIRQAERIEQLNLIVMHAEKILSAELRQRRGDQRFPDIRGLAKESLNHMLTKCGLTKGGISCKAQAAAEQFLVERAQLHDLGEEDGLPFVRVEEVNAGNDVADRLVAAFVNIVIARNYAAHHDMFDYDLVYPSESETPFHPGRVALESALLVVLGTLAAT